VFLKGIENVVRDTVREFLESETGHLNTVGKGCQQYHPSGWSNAGLSKAGYLFLQSPLINLPYDKSWSVLQFNKIADCKFPNSCKNRKSR